MYAGCHAIWLAEAAAGCRSGGEGCWAESGCNVCRIFPFFPATAAYARMQQKWQSLLLTGITSVTATWVTVLYSLVSWAGRSCSYTAAVGLVVQDAAGWLQAQHNQQQDQPQQQAAVQHPRHARVNLLKAAVQDVLAQLQDSSSSGGSSGFDVHIDDLLPDLLVFPPGTDLHDHPLVEQGVLILQVRIGKCKVCQTPK